MLIGQPDFQTPEHIVEAAIRALRDGHHGYTPATGILPLREAVVLFNRRNETQLVLSDDKLGGQKIGGTFAADQVEAFVRLLEKDGDVVAERRGAREIALRRAP